MHHAHDDLQIKWVFRQEEPSPTESTLESGEQFGHEIWNIGDGKDRPLLLLVGLSHIKSKPGS
jgi:hypothetical protein